MPNIPSIGKEGAGDAARSAFLSLAARRSSQRMRRVLTGDLPEAGDARLHGEQIQRPAPVTGDLFRCQNPWPYETHLTPQHVKELWKLVQDPASQESPYPGHPRVVSQLIVLLEGLFQLRVLLQKELRAMAASV